MRSLASISLLLVVGCGSDEPTPAEFGLDTRPANPSCIARARPVLDTGVVLERQWAGVGFNAPLGLFQAPGDNARWYVVQRGGTIRTFPETATSNNDVATFGQVAVNQGGEGGLLGFAFHPDWPNKLEVYLSYTRDVIGGDPIPPSCPGSGQPFTSVVARARSTTGAALDGGLEEVMRVGQPYSNHDGGGIGFGRDGYLYFGLGDGGSGDDPCGAGQDTNQLLGKMLRVDVDVANGYQVPADNPFVGQPGVAPEIWASGLRNPWRWSFDQETGELWVGDVGQNAWEEIDRVVKGANYGWRTCEGFHRRGSTSNLCNTPGMADPVVEHDRGDAQSITGGYVYRGKLMPSLVGTYIYGDFATGNIWALLFDAENRAAPRLLATVGAQTLASFGQSNDGEVYTVQLNGVISKLVPAAPLPPDGFPSKLSATGCFDSEDPTRPVEALIPYDVNSPLWSDGADKERFLAIPDGTTIAVAADGDWDLPIGSVIAKTFAIDKTRIETRLFMRHDDGGWGGYTYEWDDDGKDATLLPAGKVKGLAAGAWTYPSRNQCIQCHSKAAGGTIGLETAQLNRDTVYPSTNRISNQLATLDHIGMLSAPLPAPPAMLDRFPDPVAGSESVEARARSYLHANCSHCHRPMGGGQGTLDLRFATTFMGTDTCNKTNTQGPVNGATVLVSPGMPAQSIMSLRLHATDSKRMPPVSVTVVDDQGAAVVDEWISSLTACP